MVMQIHDAITHSWYRLTTRRKTFKPLTAATDFDVSLEGQEIKVVPVMRLTSV